MLSIIDRYIVKKFLGTYVFAIILIISVSVVFDLNEQSDKFIKNDAPLHAIIFDYYVNFVPYYANLFSAIFVFIAVIFFTSKLANNSEIIAMLASGMSFKRLMKPYMVSALIIAIFSFFLSAFIIPPANKTRIDFQNQYIKNKRVDYATKIQLQVEPGVIAYIDRYDNADKRGYKFSLDKFEGKELKSRLTANQIKHDSAYHWVVYDYTIREFQGMREKLSSGSEIDTTLTITPEDFLISVNGFEQMTTPDLYDYVQRQQGRGMASSVRAFDIEYHKRFANIASAFILTIIGASLSSRKIKGGMGLNIGIGLLLSVSYILFMTISSTFAISGMVSPLIAAWIPNVVFLFIAAYLYTKAPN